MAAQPTLGHAVVMSDSDQPGDPDERGLDERAAALGATLERPIEAVRLSREKIKPDRLNRRRYAARRVAALLDDQPRLSAQQVLEVLRLEADAAEAGLDVVWPAAAPRVAETMRRLDQLAEAMFAPASPEHRDTLDLQDHGSWIVSTEDGAHHLLVLIAHDDGGEGHRILPLTEDTSHIHPDGSHPLRRNGGTQALLDVIDPPIRVGRPAQLVVGVSVAAGGDHVVSTVTASPVVEIRSSR